jgi:CheY-like chemotaxis protein
MQSPQEPIAKEFEDTLEGAAHDLTNILAANLMHLSFVKRTPFLPLDVTESLGEMEIETRRAVKLVRKILKAKKKSSDDKPGDASTEEGTVADTGLEMTNGGNETILLVEDEVGLRRMTALRLRKLGYAVLEAGHSSEALEQWERCAGKIDLVLTDVTLAGGMNGLELALQLKSKKASLNVILISGHEPAPSTSESGNGIIYLHKPCEPAYLEKTIRSCLDSTDANS